MHLSAYESFLSHLSKGGVRVDQPGPDCSYVSDDISVASTSTCISSPQNLLRSVDLILEKLRGTKKLDLFECARVDPNVPIEETIKVLSEFVEQGKFDFIGMSECAADTLRRGHNVHPIAAVEIEVSPWSYQEETKKGPRCPVSLLPQDFL